VIPGQEESHFRKQTRRFLMPQTHATADFSYGCCEKYEAGVKIQTFKKGLRMSWKFTGIFGWKKIEILKKAEKCPPNNE